MSTKTLKNWPQKLLIIGPNPFISQSSPDHSPELIFHIMKSRDQTSFSYLWSDTWSTQRSRVLYWRLSDFIWAPNYKSATHYENSFTMVSYLFYSLILFPNAGPDMKYFLGFLRTQFSTTITILLVFGPKVSYIQKLCTEKTSMYIFGKGKTFRNRQSL